MHTLAKTKKLFEYECKTQYQYLNSLAKGFLSIFSLYDLPIFGFMFAL